tara:strand:- start:147 stop:647 length:501 start_codon:yes stop_codon:yes gene_type:complete
MHTIEVIEEQLSQLQKLNYNQFFWWRRWGRKTSPLHKYSPLIDKINNGDYDPSPYLWQIHYCEWEIDQKYKQYEGDSQAQASETRLDKNRRRRLTDDHQKYEKENLEQLRKDFLATFRMSKNDYKKDVVEVGGTPEEFYNYCDDKYGRYNRPSNMPRRGRPPKIKQ